MCWRRRAQRVQRRTAPSARRRAQRLVASTRPRPCWPARGSGGPRRAGSGLMRTALADGRPLQVTGIGPRPRGDLKRERVRPRLVAWAQPPETAGARSAIFTKNSRPIEPESRPGCARARNGLAPCRRAAPPPIRLAAVRVVARCSVHQIPCKLSLVQSMRFRESRTLGFARLRLGPNGAFFLALPYWPYSSRPYWRSRSGTSGQASYLTYTRHNGTSPALRPPSPSPTSLDIDSIQLREGGHALLGVDTPRALLGFDTPRALLGAGYRSIQRR